MAIAVERPSDGKLIAMCARIEAALQSGSRPVAGSVAVQAFRGDLTEIVRDDHTLMLLTGIDRFGAQRAPLAKRTLADPRRGPGPSLIPRGENSRFITNFQLVWEGTGGGATLVGRYVDILDEKGRPFSQYHATGARKAGTKWVLPRRDTTGISPHGWQELKTRFARLAPDILAEAAGGMVAGSGGSGRGGVPAPQGLLTRVRSGFGSLVRRFRRKN